MNLRSDVGLWHGDYKIPWHEPEFSRRMLAQHLAQDHDLASRRSEWIDRQVEWIHTELLHGCPARILDLGCGPGLYANRLAARNHRCRGVDFGPASIEYARRHATNAEFVLGDIREADLGGPHDLAMLLYGELNVFPPADALCILRRTHASLAPGGALVVELQPPESVERAGCGAPREEDVESGLFSDQPYNCRMECRWYEAEQVAVRTFTVREKTGAPARIYRDTIQSWSPDELRSLFQSTGYSEPSPLPGWPCEGLELWRAQRL